MKPTPLVTFAVFLSMLAPSFNVPVNAEEEPTLTITGWETVTDPLKDCEFRLTAEKLSITVPPANHDLNPKKGLNAPRVLKKVSGDFVVQVKVTGDFMSGNNNDKGNGFHFHSAGILLWESEANFLRVERNILRNGESFRCFPPLMEYWRNGEYGGTNNSLTDAKYFKGQSTWLKVDRQGYDVSVSISHDGTVWNHVKTFPVDLPEELFVGVAALNVSDIPFTADFEELIIKGK